MNMAENMNVQLDSTVPLVIMGGVDGITKRKEWIIEETPSCLVEYKQ